MNSRGGEDEVDRIKRGTIMAITNEKGGWSVKNERREREGGAPRGLKNNGKEKGGAMGVKMKNREGGKRKKQRECTPARSKRVESKTRKKGC